MILIASIARNEMPLKPWYNEKVASNAIFNFQEELLASCKSDVQLLKEGSLKFIQEFEEIARFNPLITSITIASACNHFRRKEKLEEDLIALEPAGGWHGNHINQRSITLEWLYWQDFQRGGMGRVRHVIMWTGLTNRPITY